MFGLGTTATYILLGLFAAVIVTVSAWPAGLIAVGPAALAVAGVLLIRVGGIPLGQHAVQRARWAIGTRRGHTSYRSEATVAIVGSVSLPGMLAATELISAEDGYGGR
jgi:hypothetical protein